MKTFSLTTLKLGLDALKKNKLFIVPIVFFGIVGALFIYSKGVQSIEHVYPSFLKREVARETDTSQLLSKDLSTFDFAFRIDAIHEGSESYTVSYSYQTYEILRNVWQETRKTGEVEIFKDALGDENLEVYLSLQMNQIMSQEVDYLSETKKAFSQKQTLEKSSQYASLVGEEVKKEQPSEESSDSGKRNESIGGAKTIEEKLQSQSQVPLESVVSKKEIREMVVAAVADFLAIDTSMPENFSERSSKESEP